METYHWGSRVIFIPTVVTYLNLPLYMHIDGVECMHLALYEVSHAKPMGFIAFSRLLCEFSQG